VVLGTMVKARQTARFLGAVMKASERHCWGAWWRRMWRARGGGRPIGGAGTGGCVVGK
jgi:hypothetical protein